MWQLRIYDQQDELMATVEAEGTDYHSVKMYQDLDERAASSIKGIARSHCEPQNVVEQPGQSHGGYILGPTLKIDAKERLESLRENERDELNPPITDFDSLHPLSNIKRTELVEL